MKPVIKQNVFLFVFLALAAFSSGAAPLSVSYRGPAASLPEIPESWEIRQELAEWILSSAAEARGFQPGVFRQNSDGRYISVQNTSAGDALYQMFLIEQDYAYPLARKGNYIIKRDIRDGSFLQVKIFLRDEEGSFARIFPFQDRSHMDVYLLGKAVYKDLVLPLPFHRVLTSSLEQIFALTAGRVDWSIFQEPPAGLGGESLLPVIAQIRERLPDLKDSEDGAMDEKGRYVYINDLARQPEGEGGFNCSGFAKWLADGFVLPVRGELLGINRLKEKPVTLRGNSISRVSEDSRDPFFGLDWTRSLAVSLAELQDPSGRNYSREALDVRQVPFYDYKEDVGYPLEDLERIAYLLALKNPDCFYFASINIPFGSDPILQQHTHVAVLFPYFTPLGDFRLVIMERNNETRFSSLLARYPKAHVHLVKARAEGEFRLP